MTHDPGGLVCAQKLYPIWGELLSSSTNTICCSCCAQGEDPHLNDQTPRGIWIKPNFNYRNVFLPVLVFFADYSRKCFQLIDEPTDLQWDPKNETMKGLQSVYCSAAELTGVSLNIL
jgi:hypothetical protein